MTAKNISWWFFITALGIALQWFIPGVDFLLPAYLVALIENNRWQCGVLSVLYVLIQEGLGSLDFGGILLWYVTIVCVFLLCRHLLRTRTLLFSALIGLWSGFSHYVIISLMCLLQEMEFDRGVLFADSCKQVLVVILLWKAVQKIRWGNPYENKHRN